FNFLTRSGDQFFLYHLPALQQSSALCSIHLGRPIRVLRTRILPAMAAPNLPSHSNNSACMAGFAITSIELNLKRD
ncbi:MAG: hypothetical protein WBP86_00445, partial [Thiobacillaceae bacterium]